MAIPQTEFFRSDLMERRTRLQSAAVRMPAHRDITDLLAEVDSALERIEAGTYGVCETCHDPIEMEGLLANPLMQYCIADLNESQRNALQQDLDLASTIQNRLLPNHNLKANGWDIAYHYEAAGPVSGDYCDVVETPGAEVLFMLGDVSGKGVAASMLMAHLNAIFRSLSSLDLDVRGLMERANRIFSDSTTTSHYATLVCGRASRSGNVEIGNAGHCPVLLNRGGQVETLDSTGLPLGIFYDGKYEVHKLTVEPGESLLLYTDGISEAPSPSGEEYGIDRIKSVCCNPHSSPRDLLGACLQDLAGFQQGTPKSDDLTVMAVQRMVQ